MVAGVTILTTFPCGCAAYREMVSGIVEWGVKRCDEHLASGTLPKEAEKYFDVERGETVASVTDERDSLLGEDT